MPAAIDRLFEPREHRAPFTRAGILAGAALIVIFSAVFFWRTVRTGSAPYAPPPVEVSARPVQFETLPQSLESTGSLQAVRSVTLAPEAPGRVVAIHFTAGSAVSAGTPLVQLFDAPERADLAAAISRAQFAKLQYGRSQQLAPAGAEPKEILQQREAELAQADAAIQQVKARLAQKIIRAPFAGQIGIRRVDPGQYVNAGDALATLTDLDQLYVNFTVPQQQLSKLRVGGQVTVRSDAYPDRTFTARINVIEPLVGQDTRNVLVQAMMANPGRALHPGLYVTASIAQPPRAQAIVVPATAVQTGASGDSVFVVRQGKAQAVPVVTGQRVGERVVIDTGLAPGDVVITSGQLRVQPGAPVTVAAAPAHNAGR